jgi:flagellar FliL protein
MSTTPEIAPTAAPEEAAAPAPAARRGFPKLLVIGVVALLVLGGAGWFLVPKLLGKRPAPAEAKPAPVAVKATLSLGAVVVNLKGDARRYARVGVSLGVSAAKEVKEVEESKTQLTDLVITLLSSQEADKLVSVEGREEVKQELLKRIHEELHLETVARVYFTEFVVQ